MFFVDRIPTATGARVCFHQYNEFFCYSFQSIFFSQPSKQRMLKLKCTYVTCKINAPHIFCKLSFAALGSTLMISVPSIYKYLEWFLVYFWLTKNYMLISLKRIILYPFTGASLRSGCINAASTLVAIVRACRLNFFWVHITSKI